MALFCCSQMSAWHLWQKQGEPFGWQTPNVPWWAYRECAKIGTNSLGWPVWYGYGHQPLGFSGVGYNESYVWVQDHNYAEPRVATRSRNTPPHPLVVDPDDIGEDLSAFAAWHWTGTSWTQIEGAPTATDYAPHSIACISPPHRAWTPHVDGDRDPLYPFEFDVAELLEADGIEIEFDGPGGGVLEFDADPLLTGGHPLSRSWNVGFSSGDGVFRVRYGRCDGAVAKPFSVNVFTGFGPELDFDEVGYSSFGSGIGPYEWETWSLWMFDRGEWMPEWKTSPFSTNTSEAIVQHTPFWLASSLRPTGRNVIRVEVV